MGRTVQMVAVSLLQLAVLEQKHNSGCILWVSLGAAAGVLLQDFEGICFLDVDLVDQVIGMLDTSKGEVKGEKHKDLQ